MLASGGGVGMGVHLARWLLVRVLCRSEVWFSLVMRIRYSMPGLRSSAGWMRVSFPLTNLTSLIDLWLLPDWRVGWNQGGMSSMGTAVSCALPLGVGSREPVNA